MKRVIHFELPADNPERAVRFYTDVFDWKIEKWEEPVDYWLITTGSDDQPGINGALNRRGESMGAVNTIDVPSIDDFIRKIETGGGKVVLPKIPVSGVGYMAYWQDTEGNTFGMMQDDISAR